MAINKTAKLVLIAVIVLVLLGVGIVAVGVIFLKLTPQGRRMGQSFDAKEVEGKEFGKTTDQRGCITEGLARGGKLSGINITEEVGNRYFVKSCLRSSQPTAGFCDGVPSHLMSSDWEEKECKRIRMPTGACEDVLKEKILFCTYAAPAK